MIQQIIKQWTRRNTYISWDEYEQTSTIKELFHWQQKNRRTFL